MATAEVVNETVAYASGQSITGVTILGGSGNQQDQSGNATLYLEVVGGNKYLTFSPYGEVPNTKQSPGYQNTMSCSADGTFVLSWYSGARVASVVVSIVVANLPTVNSQAGLVVTRPFENLLDSTSETEARQGSSNYRCIYLKNPGAAAINLAIYFFKAPTSGQGASIGFDPAGAGGVAQVIANEGASPAGVNFSVPRYPSEALTTALAAGQAIALWIKRLVLPAQSLTVHGDSFQLVVEVS